MTQEPNVRQLLPVAKGELEDAALGSNWDYLYEPDAEEVLNGLMTRYLESQVYQGVVESNACEQTARMIAMKAATDNAGDLIRDLNLVYNKARQAAITQRFRKLSVEPRLSSRSSKRRLTMSSGKIVQIIGAVVDVEFPRSDVPKVYDLNVENLGLTLEVQQQLGDGVVRAIAMGSTEFDSWHEASNTGAPINVPVGTATLGRIMDVLGTPIDEKGDIGEESRMPIHRKAPSFSEQAASAEILETGIKVIDGRPLR